MLNYSQDLNDTVSEAISVRLELEDIMKEAIELSQAIVNDFEDKFSPPNDNNISTDISVQFDEMEIDAIRSILLEDNPSLVEVRPAIFQEFVTEDLFTEESFIEEPVLIESEGPVFVSSINPEKIRIYELAREMDIPSKELLNMIKDMGISVNNHMNMLDEDQVLLVRQVITNAEMNPEQEDKASVLVNNETIPAQILPSEGLAELLIDEQIGQEEDDLAASLEDDQLSASPITELVEKDEISQLGFSIEELKSAHPYIAVKTLHEKGYSVREIAKLLNRGQGEVSLIMNLSKKKQAAI